MGSDNRVFKHLRAAASLRHTDIFKAGVSLALVGIRLFYPLAHGGRARNAAGDGAHFPLYVLRFAQGVSPTIGTGFCEYPGEAIPAGRSRDVSWVVKRCGARQYRRVCVFLWHPEWLPARNLSSNAPRASRGALCGLRALSNQAQRRGVRHPLVGLCRDSRGTFFEGADRTPDRLDARLRCRTERVLFQKAVEIY